MGAVSEQEKAWLHDEYLCERIKVIFELIMICLQLHGCDVIKSDSHILPAGSSTLVLSTYKADWIKGFMQLEVDTISKMDLNVLALSPKAAESVLSLKQGGFKIAQISMLINALQRILHLYSNQQTSATTITMLREELMRARDILFRPQYAVETYEIQRYFEPPLGDLTLACYVEEGEIKLKANWPSNKLKADISSVSPTLRASYLLIQTALNQVLSLEHLCQSIIK